jgi:hypothetical protein
LRKEARRSERLQGGEEAAKRREVGRVVSWDKGVGERVCKRRQESQKKNNGEMQGAK